MARFFDFSNQLASDIVVDGSFPIYAPVQFSPKPNTKYAFLANVMGGQGANYNDYIVAPRFSLWDSDLNELENFGFGSLSVPYLSEGVVVFGGCFVYEFNNNPPDTVIFGSRSEIISSGLFTDTRSAVLELTSDDVYVTSTSTTTTTSVSPVNACTLTWTPASSGDYIVISSASLDSDDRIFTDTFHANSSTSFGTAEESLLAAGHPDPENRRAHSFYAFYLDSLSGPQTVNFRIASPRGDDVYCYGATILALRVSALEDVFQSALTTPILTISQTLVSALSSGTVSTQGGYYLSIASCVRYPAGSEPLTQMFKNDSGLRSVIKQSTSTSYALPGRLGFFDFVPMALDSQNSLAIYYATTGGYTGIENASLIFFKAVPAYPGIFAVNGVTQKYNDLYSKGDQPWYW